MILCGGDALIDFVPVAAPDGGQAFSPRVGGAVLNAATALARLGEEVSFVGALSTDLFGDLLFEHMRAEGIATDHVSRAEDDSTLAFVSLTGGEARYAFYDRTSAGRHWTGLGRPPEATAIHMGSVTLIEDPSASAYLRLAEQVGERMVVSLDPNCRPTLIKDPETYRRRIEKMAALSHILRISDEDFTYLFGSASEANVVARILAGRTELVVISRGPDGATAYWSGGRRDVAPRPVRLVDSIGAGDTFHAGLLAALSRSERLKPGALGTLSVDEMDQILTFATAAAALNCERTGCNPPDLEAVLSSLG